jgi:hypothetical protein
MDLMSAAAQIATRRGGTVAAARVFSESSAAQVSRTFLIAAREKFGDAMSIAFQSESRESKDFSSRSRGLRMTRISPCQIATNVKTIFLLSHRKQRIGTIPNRYKISVSIFRVSRPCSSRYRGWLLPDGQLQHLNLLRVFYK